MVFVDKMGNREDNQGAFRGRLPAPSWSWLANDHMFFTLPFL